MPRPIKWRRVDFLPEVTYFKPTGIPMRALEVVSLSVEELEAVRLKDQEGLRQEDCASRMGISRPTFHRVLGSARSKIADALTNSCESAVEHIAASTAAVIMPATTPGNSSAATRGRTVSGSSSTP